MRLWRTIKNFDVLAVYEVETAGGRAHGHTVLCVTKMFEASDMPEAQRIIGERFEAAEKMPAKTVVILNLIRLPIT